MLFITYLRATKSQGRVCAKRTSNKPYILPSGPSAPQTLINSNRHACSSPQSQNQTFSIREMRVTFCEPGSTLHSQSNRSRSLRTVAKPNHAHKSAVAARHFGDDTLRSTLSKVESIKRKPIIMLFGFFTANGYLNESYFYLDGSGSSVACCRNAPY